MKITVPESSQTSESQHGSPSFVQFGGVQYRAVRIRLLKNLSDFNDKRYVAGEEFLAGADDDFSIYLPTVEFDGSQGVAGLNEGEFEIIDSIGIPINHEPENTPTADAFEIVDEYGEAIEKIDAGAMKPVVVSAPKSSAKSFASTDSSPDIHAAELAYLEAGHECKRISDEIARLEAEHLIAVDRHRSLGVDLCRVLEKRLRETLAETECEVKIKGCEAGSLASNQTYSTQSHSSSATAISEHPTGDYSNLTAAISELWADNPIERFGPKKQEAMIDACPTIGDFERLREQAGRSYRPLHSLLPDKIGELVADELENRFVDWWKKNAANSGDCVDYTTKPARPTKTASESVDECVDMAGDADMGPQRGPSSVAKISAESSQAIQQIEDASALPAEIESDDGEPHSNGSAPAETESDTDSESENPYQF